MDSDRDESSEDEVEAAEKFSLNSESDDEDSESDADEEMRGADTLMSREMDIPIVNDIPIVSKLAKEDQQK
jgi:hypothetical protein